MGRLPGTAPKLARPPAFVYRFPQNNCRPKWPDDRGEMPMLRSRVTRRTLLARTALATTAVVAAPYVRGANAAGSLSIGFWDHWVPGANKASQTLCEEWGEKNKVSISIDYITSQGNKNLLTIAAEAQAQ